MPSTELLDDNSEKKDAKKLYKGKAVGIAWKLEQAERNIQGARNMLYALGGMLVLEVIIHFILNDWSKEMEATIAIIVLNSILIGIFCTCAFFTIKYPIPSLSIALSVYLALQVLVIILDPASIGRGLLWRLVIIMMLVIGLCYAIYTLFLKKQLAAAELESLK